MKKNHCFKNKELKQTLGFNCIESIKVVVEVFGHLAGMQSDFGNLSLESGYTVWPF